MAYFQRYFDASCNIFQFRYDLIYGECNSCTNFQKGQTFDISDDDMNGSHSLAGTIIGIIIFCIILFCCCVGGAGGHFAGCFNPGSNIGSGLAFNFCLDFTTLCCGVDTACCCFGALLCCFAANATTTTSTGSCICCSKKQQQQDIYMTPMPQSQLQQYPSPPPPPPGVIYSQVPNVTYIQTQSSYPVSTTSGVYIPQYQPQYIQNQPTEPLPVVYGTIAVNTVDPINYVQPSAPSNQELV